MKVTDDVVKEEFKSKRYVYNPNTLRRYTSRIEGKYNKDIYEYLINRYDDSDSLKETLFRIYNGIEEHPKWLKDIFKNIVVDYVCKNQNWSKNIE